MALQQSKQGNLPLPVSLGAGVGIRVGLQNLFNDNSEEAKLLAFQLGLLKDHLKGVGDKSLQQRAEKLVLQTKILDYLKPGGMYLDVGAGLGHIVEKILKEKGQEGVKFISSDPIRYPASPVKKRVDQNYPGQALFIKAEGEHLPIAPNSLDGVSLFFVLHHIPQAQHTVIIDEIRNSLKAGGYLFLVEDTPEGEEERQQVAKWDKRLNLETSGTGHFYRSYREWVDFFENNGFELVDHSSFEDISSFKNEGLIRHSSLIVQKVSGA